MSIRIAGSLWSVPPDERDAQSERLSSAGLDLWHWDSSDGTIGPAGGFTAGNAERIAVSTGARSEAHLMLADPRPAIAAWARFAELIVVHAESPHWRESVDQIRSAGAQPGVALSPDFPAQDIDLEPDLAILLMTVAPGNAGSLFLEARLSELDRYKHHVLRGVDGSVNLERSQAAVAEGANWIVSGTALTIAPDPTRWLAELQHQCGTAEDERK